MSKTRLGSPKYKRGDLGCRSSYTLHRQGALRGGDGATGLAWEASRWCILQTPTIDLPVSGCLLFTGCSLLESTL